MGMDNPGFDSLSIQEKYSKSGSKEDIREDIHFPKNEERILL